jgi:hypothetical protein
MRMSLERLAIPPIAPALALAFAACVVAGAAVAFGFGPALIGAGFAAGALVAAGRWRRGIVIGACLLGALNGLPFLDVRELSVGVALDGGDLFVLVMLAALAIWNLEEGAHLRSPRTRRLALAWAAVVAGWWMAIWIWSLAQGIPPLEAGIYGRDFLYFALLVPLMLGALRGAHDVTPIAATLGAAAVAYAVVQHLGEFAGFDTSSFIHAGYEAEIVGGYTRHFADMGYLEVAAIPFGVGLVLFGAGRVSKIAGWVLVLVVGSAVALQFTRSNYIALVLAFAIVTALWAARAGEPSQRLRRATAVGVAALVAAFVVFELVDLNIDPDSAPGAVVERVTTGVTEVKRGGGSWEARREIYDQMLETLGTRWPVGLGFLDPSVHYVVGVPHGNIRHTDVGLMNAVMTMGVVGLVLILLPPLAIVALSVRTAALPLRHAWIPYGASVFLLQSVLSSPSLMTLFTVGGLALTGAVCATAARELDASERHSSAS